MKFFALIFAVLLAGTAIFSGCSNYSLGRGNDKLNFSTISLAPIKNSAELPSIHALLAKNIADEFNSEADLAFVPEGGNAELFVKISGYGRSGFLNSSEDTAIVSAVKMKITLLCTLRDSRSGEIYFQNRKISASVETFLGSATGLAENQALPELSRAAAKKVREAVTATW